MSTAKARSKVRLVRSENKWGRSNKRHFARKTSDSIQPSVNRSELTEFHNQRT